MEHFPRDIFFNIFSRLPLKSVIESSCVSKSWFNLIKDPAFVKLYTTQALPEPSLLVLARRIIGDKNIISITPIKHKDHHLVANETPIDHIVSPVSWDLVGTCNGLLCFTSSGEEELTMVCNPVSREHIMLPKSSITLSSDSWASKLAFGFDPVANRYKLLRLLYPIHSEFRGPDHILPQLLGEVHPHFQVNHAPDPQFHVRPRLQVNGAPHPQFHGNAAPRPQFHAAPRPQFHARAHFQYAAALHAQFHAPNFQVPAAPRPQIRAEVYTLGVDSSWREIQIQGYDHLPHDKPVYTNGFIHWLVNGGINKRIMSFNVGSEGFELREHPRFYPEISLAELGGNLAVVDVSMGDLVDIWILKDQIRYIWEMEYIIPVRRTGWLDRMSPRLIGVSELDGVLMIWLQDNLRSYEKKAMRIRDLRVVGFPIWLDWEICGGYRAGLVPLRSDWDNRDAWSDLVRFISDSELHSLLLSRSEGIDEQKKEDGKCGRIVACFSKNGMLI